MTIRLTLLCAAAPTGREVRFADTPLDERALRQARTAAAALPAATTCHTAPSQRCRQTAEALGWDSLVTEPALRDLEMGRWYGRTPEEIATADPVAFSTWLSDPEAAPHGGESVADVCRRIDAWLGALPDGAGQVVAVVEQAVARAAVICALAAPPASFWRIDVPPLDAVRLTGRAGRWNLRMGAVSSVGDGSTG
ncbi:histidine phosphatase family protein [Streptomyces sp. P17]|uniref:histidine phosphatase family protein n=1 Tax=Streptomyces sp. P17 TaxID=3074716 RepID=UPI0028F3EF2B|nr:histidine phosphatase family protein [Streptomyces sp. P17]MDT9698372.1 histidine phosphatase family protein [Streptomyces sp. P17]